MFTTNWCRNPPKNVCFIDAEALDPMSDRPRCTPTTAMSSSTRWHHENSGWNWESGRGIPGLGLKTRTPYKKSMLQRMTIFKSVLPNLSKSGLKQLHLLNGSAQNVRLWQRPVLASTELYRLDLTKTCGDVPKSWLLFLKDHFRVV